MNPKPKIAIFDLTDCEGCQLQILSLEKELVNLSSCVDILNWRLVKDNNKISNYDIAFVEGTVITNNDVKAVKLLREKSQIIVALGACACIGGVTSSIDTNNQKKYINKIYNENYKPLRRGTKPISSYINIDYFIHGCPINITEFKKIFAQIINNQKYSPISYPVCYECKSKENSCLLLKNEPCLGPITQGGCDAICLANNVKCYGCRGISSNANLAAMKKILAHQGRSNQEIEKIIDLFM
jgi:coenzyme F420-reducing hydrogenase gamma subunit